MSNLNLIPECYGDTLLVEILGFKRPNHQTSGIGQVIKVMKEKYSNRLAIGIIDADKKITHCHSDLVEESLIKNNNKLRFLDFVNFAQNDKRNVYYSY